jgi:hypothetical protein
MHRSFLFGALAAATGCWQSNTMNLGGAPDADTDADTDTDTDTDSDTDTDTDTDAEPDSPWHTFYGASGHDYSEGIAVGADGGIVAVGFSEESWDGPSGEPPLNAHSGGGDMFALALSPDGMHLWHTFFGAPEGCVASAAAIAADGEIFVAGASGGSWDGPSGQAPLHPFSEGVAPGVKEAFVLALTADGDYLWHAFFGSTAGEIATGVAADAAGRIVVTGIGAGTWSGPGGEAPLHGGEEGVTHLFAAALDSDGSYLWHTFYGPITGEDLWWSSDLLNGENGPSASIAPSGALIVATTSFASWSGDGGAEPLEPYTNIGDAAVLALTADGGYLWHTFLGGEANDRVGGVAVTSSGVIAVAGASSVAWDGPAGEEPLHAFETDIQEDSNVFAIGLDADGGYSWHTFFSPTDNSGTRAAIAAAGGGLVLAGSALDTWLGPDGEEPLHPHSGYRDFFVAGLDADGGYAWHAFFGSDETDVMRGVAPGAGGSIVAIGDSSASWDGPGAPHHAYSGGWDAAIVKIVE